MRDEMGNFKSWTKNLRFSTKVSEKSGEKIGQKTLFVYLLKINKSENF